MIFLHDFNAFYTILKGAKCESKHHNAMSGDQTQKKYRRKAFKVISFTFREPYANSDLKIKGGRL